MSSGKITFETPLPVPKEELYKWHIRPGAFQRLLPPWEKITPLQYPAKIAEGSVASLSCSIAGPLCFTWNLAHRNIIENNQFEDFQLSGPFSSYKHSHRFSSTADGSLLTDQIEYQFPFHKISSALFGKYFESRLTRTFAYRTKILKSDLEFHQSYQEQPRLKFLVLGASGMIGKNLCAFLSTAGHQVYRILRKKDVFFSDKDFLIEKNGRILLPPRLDIDCVINLAGEGIANNFWTKSFKQRLIDSRINSTKNLIAALAQLQIQPKTLINASGVGYYGDSKICFSEDAPVGTDFLSHLCKDWEAEANKAKDLGIRVVNLRLGIVLSLFGGVLARIKPVFSLGLGAKIGRQDQKFAWVALDDVLKAILFIGYNQQVAGPINLVAPQDISAPEFYQTVAKSLKRPLFFSVPQSLLKSTMGEMAQELFLTSNYCSPAKLTGYGYRFKFNNLEKFLGDEL